MHYASCLTIPTSIIFFLLFLPYSVVHGIGITFIQPIFHSSFFSRERVYGYADDFERYCFFPLENSLPPRKLSEMIYIVLLPNSLIHVVLFLDLLLFLRQLVLQWLSVLQYLLVFTRIICLIKPRVLLFLIMLIGPPTIF